MEIEKLYRAKEQPSAKTTSTTTTATENWILHTDEAAIPVQVNALVKALEEDNDFGFLISGQIHPDDASLTILGFTVSRAIDDTYSKYIVTTNMTNNNGAINSNVTPSKAQDSWNFSNEQVDVQVTITAGTSKNTSGPIKALDGEAIENTNGRGIIVFEKKYITRVVITRNESDYNLKTAASHVGKVNSGGVAINGSSFSAGTCKLVKWAGADAYDSDGRLYWRVTYEILVTDDPAFFERVFIMRGVIDSNGQAAPIAANYISDTEYKLDENGIFLLLPDQKNPKKFTAKSFVTIESSGWGPAVRLGSSPNRNLTTLTGDSGFGLIKS